MIKEIIDLLSRGDFLIKDEDISIAKGKYQAPTRWNEIKPHIKRNRL